jgi:uncharacterized protein (TIGR00304 family)
LVASAVLGWTAWQRGEIDLYLFLIFPVLKAEGAWGAAALLLGFAALVILALAFWAGVAREGSETGGKVSAGGVIMIGPLPIVLGTDRGITVLVLVLTVVVVMVMMMLLLFQ